MVAALVAAGYVVYAVNPLQRSRFRERLGVSGAKSDPGNSHMLADMVRTDSHQLRAVPPTARRPAASSGRAHPQNADLGTNPAGAAAAASAAEYFPAALEAFEDLAAPNALELLAKHRTRRERRG